ncbi:MAG: radical SAM protein, partial [Chitinophagaceae bacterium]|nr:radical SAM protein [Chitinophagaceae bacterium]
TFSLKRVYYSGYIPISNDERMPVLGSQPPLLRENRLYQTDWLMRFYGFTVEEILNDEYPDLDAELDPKLAWALRNPAAFPVDVHTAEYRMILRIPGVGVSSAQKIVQARKFGKLHRHQLAKMGIAMNRAQHFLRCADSPFRLNESDPAAIRQAILADSNSKFRDPAAKQLSLF